MVGVHAHAPLFTLTTPSTQVMSPPSTPSPARLARCSYLYSNHAISPSPLLSGMTCYCTVLYVWMAKQCCLFWLSHRLNMDYSRSPKFIWSRCAQHSCAQWLRPRNPPPPPRAPHIRGAVGQPRWMTSLYDPLGWKWHLCVMSDRLERSNTPQEAWAPITWFLFTLNADCWRIFTMIRSLTALVCCCSI